MNSYAERLAWAMTCQGLDPKTDQTRLARMVGPPCKPQNISALLSPDHQVKHSKYTLPIAQVLGCDPQWLGTGTGKRPEVSARYGNVANLGTPPPQVNDGRSGYRVANGADVEVGFWPFSISPELFQQTLTLADIKAIDQLINSLALSKSATGPATADMPGSGQNRITR